MTNNKFPTQEGWWWLYIVNKAQGSRSGVMAVYIRFVKSLKYGMVMVGGSDLIIANIDDKGNLLSADQAGNSFLNLSWEWRGPIDPPMMDQNLPPLCCAEIIEG